MAKPKATFVCNSCGTIHNRWSGQCAACNAWDSITEDVSSVVHFSKATGTKGSKNSSSKIDIYDLSEAVKEPQQRMDTTFDELNRVLGGGLVEGSAILIGGEPGVGKSTILLEAAAKIALNGNNVLYITGEESVSQVSMRAERLGLSKSTLKLASATNVDEIIKLTKSEFQPNLLIIDSIQTMFLPTVESSPGTVSQVRFRAHELISAAKQNGFALILVGHVTKDGQIAGPRVLEHMVDTVLYFEGEKGFNYRILRAVKNRFGPANELGIFEMGEQGLKEVKNPSSLFISGSSGATAGSVIFAGIEGTRPILVEIQALVSPSYMATPRRTVVGWDVNRLAMIIAVLQSRCNIKLFDKEVYLNIAGGIKLTEPAADLAVAAAIISANSGSPYPTHTAIFGEVSLSGEIRPVSRTKERIKEAQKLGFKKFILPFSDDAVKELKDYDISFVKHLREIAF